MRTNNLCLAFFVTGLLASTAWAQRHSDDFEVGYDPRTNQVAVRFEPGNFPWELPPSEFPLLKGFALDDPGFVSLDPNEQEPGEFEQLKPDANIALKLLATSNSAMKLWDPAGPGENGFQILGDRIWNIGKREFDEHPVWHIDTADPNYNANGLPYSVTFQLLDTKGLHRPSDPVEVTFVPEPATALMLALSLVGTRRRQS